MARWAFCVAMFVCFACSPPAPLPEMQSGETGRVTRVIDGDAIVLDTGLSVRLVSILAPAMYPRDGDPEPYAGESARVLEDLALGRRVQLYYPGLTRDRYDRALAHVVTIDGAGPKLWLNQAMIVRGAARVRLYPSTAARGQDLLTLEAAAREAREGLWRERAYAVQDAATLAPGTDGFVLVTATLGPARPVNPDLPFPPSCFRTLLDADLIVSVRRAAASTCGIDDGTRVLLRGWLSEGEIDLSHPWHIEILSAD